jgi:predicted transcriptional regulator
MNWCALISPLVHPTKVLIIEAMLWIERPMSAAELDKTFGNAVNLSTISYHVKSLARLGILERVGKRQVRGALESFYCFAAADG